MRQPLAEARESVPEQDHAGHDEQQDGQIEQRVQQAVQLAEVYIAVPGGAEDNARSHKDGGDNTDDPPDFQVVPFVVEKPETAKQEPQEKQADGLRDASLHQEPIPGGEEAAAQTGRSRLQESAFGIGRPHLRIILHHRGDIRFPAGKQAVNLQRLNEQEKGHRPQHRRTQIPRRNQQQAHQGIKSKDIAVIEDQIQQAEPEKQHHAPGKTEGEVLPLLLLVVPHDKKAEAEQQGENAVHLARQQYGEHVEHGTVYRQ